MKQIKLFLLWAIFGIWSTGNGSLYAQEKNVSAPEMQTTETPAQTAPAKGKGDNNRFEVSKQLNIFNALVKEMELFYVDTIDIQKAVHRAIDAMLHGLDPYTEYIPEDEMEQFNFHTTGEYGGIGATIRMRDGGAIITGLFKNMPAVEVGLKAGDKILSVDTVDVANLPVDRVSELLKGVPNTKVTLKIQRPGEKKSRKFELVRRKIVVNQVTHYGVYAGNVGYIYLNSFTDRCAQEVKAAFEDMKQKHDIQSLILDLRDNGGGVLESAVQLINLFVPKDKEILTTRGKNSRLDRTYRTYNEPVDTLLPLAVLINGASASASEVVCGALQDFDRAILVGQRSFGKGLVQSTRELPYDGKLKVTMSKYYIPSGRCIQQLDYTHRHDDGSVAAIPDSLTSVFYTANGRPVRDGGGVRPDFEVEEEKMPAMLYYLYIDRDYMLFDYITSWVAAHNAIPPAEDFIYTDEDYELFKQYLIEKRFEYDRQSGKALNALKETAAFEGFTDEDSTMFVTLEKKLQPDLALDLDRYKKEIKRLIAVEIVKRYYFDKGEIQLNLIENNTFNRAIEVLKDRESYSRTLQGTGKAE